MSYGNCFYCNSEIKNKKYIQKFDNKLFCNNTHKKLYCLEKIKNNNFDDKYINELINIDTLRFKNSNFVIEDSIKTKIIKYLWNKKGFEDPKCLTCGKNLFEKYILENKFYNPFKEEIKFCSYKCSTNNKELNQIRRKKISEKSKIISEKRKQTCLKKYGNENFNNREKAKKTCLKKYGFENHMKNNKYKNLFVENIQNKYGVKSIFQLEKYKNNHHTKNHIKNSNNFNKNFIEENFIKNGIIDFKGIKEYFNISDSYTYKIIHDFNISGKLKNSKEKEILEFIKKHYDGEILTNTRKIIPNKELDIYIPEFNFAIEYDGIFFHSQGNHPFFKNIDKNYHLEKTELCEQNGIHLFHIFSNEWLDEIKQDIWKSKILLKLKSKKIKKYNARDGIIKKIETKIARQFLKENHLQGYSESKIKLGFFINNELLAVMTFGKSRFKKDEYELIRFASKKYITIRGLFGKFLKYFENNYIKKLNIKKLISFGNRRWVYKNNVYQKFMKLEKIIEPNFYVFNDELNLYHRIKFQKHKLKNILNIYNENLSAKENIFNNGYRIIYDVGNFKYYKNYIFK